MSSESRRFRLYLVYLGLLLPAVIFGAAQTIQSNSNSPLEWVSDEFPPRAAFRRFLDDFGSGDLLVVGWPNCRIDDESVDAVSRGLRRRKAFFDESGTSYFDHVVSGKGMLGTLRRAHPTTDPDELLNRLVGSWVGRDRRSTFLVLAFTPEALERRGDIVDRVRVLVHRAAGVPLDDIHLAGPVMDGLTVDRLSRQTLQSLALPSSALVFLLAWWFLGTLRGAAIVCGVATLAQGMTLALIYFCGDTMSALLIVLPPLVQVLAIAGGLHLANYYVERSSEPLDAAREAVRIGWLPCILSGGTTALGIASLSTSGLTPIRSFATYGAAGVLITTGLVLSLVPALFARLRVRPGGTVSSEFNSTTSVSSRRLARIMQRLSPAIVLLFLLVMATASVGIARLKASVRIETLFSPGSRILDDYTWLESHVGALVPIEIVLEFDPESDMAHSMRVADRVESKLRELKEVRATLSAAAWSPVGQGLSVDAMLQHAPADATRLGDLLEQVGYVKAHEGRRDVRVTAFVSALERLDYAELLDRVRSAVEEVTQDPTDQPRALVGTTFTGTMPLVHAIQRRLMHDLFLSFLGALVVVTIVMTLVQAGFFAGIVSMLPNVFPVVVLFGLIGWLDSTLDIGSVMTASIALGIAVDDTLHFLVAYRRSIDEGRNNVDSVASAFGHCSRAMIQTSVVCGLGLLLFALSDFVPTQRFAWMMSSLLGLALVGDLVLLPTLLLSPVGRWVMRASPDEASSSHVSSGKPAAGQRPRRREVPLSG